MVAVRTVRWQRSEKENTQEALSIERARAGGLFCDAQARLSGGVRALSSPSELFLQFSPIAPLEVPRARAQASALSPGSELRAPSLPLSSASSSRPTRRPQFATPAPQRPALR